MNQTLEYALSFSGVALLDCSAWLSKQQNVQVSDTTMLIRITNAD